MTDDELGSDLERKIGEFDLDNYQSFSAEEKTFLCFLKKRNKYFFGHRCRLCSQGCNASFCGTK